MNLHGWLARRLRTGFTITAVVVSVTTAVLLVVASAIDRTLTMPARDIGLFEHPGIWAFLIAQVMLPKVVRSSIIGLAKARYKIRPLLAPGASFGDAVIGPVQSFIKMETRQAKAFAMLFYLVGFAAFVWNTYQNQFPYTVVPFDFWDSARHPFGYWSTRAYKFYLFVWLLPYLALIQTAILMVLLNTIASAKSAGRLRLIPFDDDGVGGLGYVPPLVTAPVLATLFVGSLPLAGAFWVHRAFDVTPVFGLALLMASGFLAYGVAIWRLRAILVQLKKETIGKLRSSQQSIFDDVMSKQIATGPPSKEASEALEHIDKLCSKVQAISNYPHLHRFIKMAGLAVTPSLVSLSVKAFEAITKSGGQ